VAEKVYKRSILSQEIPGGAGNHTQDLGAWRTYPGCPLPESDLRDNYPLASSRPREDVVRVHASSDHKGQPTVVATPQDIETWLDLMAATSSWSRGEGGIFRMRELRIFHRGPGGALRHRTHGRHGCSIRVGIREATEIMMDFVVTVLHCTPSYASSSAETPRKRRGGKLKLRIGCFGAEPGLMSQAGA